MSSGPFRALIIQAAVAAFAIAVTSCGAAGTMTSPPPPPPSSPTTIIGPSGGTVTSANGAVQLTFPAGALGSSLGITVDSMTDAPTDPALVAGAAYNFGPSGSQFAQPVTITIHYQPSQVPVGVGPIFIRLYLRDGDG